MSLLPDEWSKFQLDLAYCIAGADEPRNGVDLRAELEQTYDERIGNARLYQNLDALVERDIVEKQPVTERENHYVLTDAGRDRLLEDLETRDFR